MYCGCKMNWAAAYSVSFLQLVKAILSLLLAPQHVCNHGNYSVVKTTNLFLQCKKLDGDCYIKQPLQAFILPALHDTHSNVCMLAFFISNGTNLFLCLEEWTTIKKERGAVSTMTYTQLV